MVDHALISIVDNVTRFVKATKSLIEVMILGNALI
jgi:hypothetical protein